MQRARIRRRAAVSATAAALLVGAGAGVLALTAGPDQTTLRSRTSEDLDQPVPTVTAVVVPSTNVTTTVSTTVPTTVSTTVAGLEEPLTVIEPPTTVAPASTPPDENRAAATEDTQARPVVDEPPATPVPAGPPPAAAPPAAPAPASFQTITSACGEIVVSIDAGTVRIVTITSLPGFDQRVSDDGPNSIEMTFNGEDDQKCELHAELKSGGLDIEVQNPETGR